MRDEDVQNWSLELRALEHETPTGGITRRLFHWYIPGEASSVKMVQPHLLFAGIILVVAGAVNVLWPHQCIRLMRAWPFPSQKWISARWMEDDEIFRGLVVFGAMSIFAGAFLLLGALGL
jgi:hypothetical protein